jgi:hypothetical protein
MLNLLDAYPCNRQAVFDRFGREPRAMFAAIESFFFDGGDEFAVSNDCRSRVPVICINT